MNYYELPPNLAWPIIYLPAQAFFLQNVVSKIFFGICEFEIFYSFSVHTRLDGATFTETFV